MTEYKDYNRDSFNKVADFITKNGDIPLNPAILPGGLSQFEYMDICIAMLRCADVIYMLPGWEESEGACAELALARKLRLEERGIRLTQDTPPQEAENKYEEEKGPPRADFDSHYSWLVWSCGKDVQVKFLGVWAQATILKVTEFEGSIFCDVRIGLNKVRVPACDVREMQR